MSLPLSSSELGQWIAKHMPDLGAELGPMSHDQARLKLNEVTGLNITGGESIRATLPLYLAKLEEMHKGKQLL